MRARKIALIGIILIFVLTACGTTATSTTPDSGEGYPVATTFLDFYNTHDGLRTLGVAISSEQPENGVLVQYFENGRLEYHPQLPANSQIVLANLGELLYGPSPCVEPESVESGALYFSATCHSVRLEFRTFFDKYGGVSFFGYPISEMYIENGRFVQRFERAIIIWDGAQSPEFQFRLDHLGTMACHHKCSSGRGPDTILPATPTPQPPTDQIDAFYRAHGGERVFGLPLGGRQAGSDGTIERVYENAVLYENPAVPESVSLRPLGLQTLGSPAARAPQLDDPYSAYYDKYGHNVAYGIYEFYEKYGGEAVFGQPINEPQVIDDHLVQYFENAVVTWRPGLPTDQAVQLVNLGQQALPIQSITPAPASPQPQMLIVATEPIYNILAAETTQQTLRAWVTDENGLAVVGARVIFVMNTPGGELKYIINTTDANGYASVTFSLKSYKPGAFMVYTATASYSGLTTSRNGAFVPWGRLHP